MTRHRRGRAARTGEDWRPVSDPPPEGERVLVRFYIRERAENVEYVLAGERRGDEWFVKTPWDSKGIDVRHRVLPTHWAPMPRERPVPWERRGKGPTPKAGQASLLRKTAGQRLGARV